MSDSKDIIDKYAREDKLREMAKKMAEEEQRRRDINVQHWDGMQSNKAYLFSLSSGKWSQMSNEGKFFYILGALATITVIFILIFTLVKSFSM